MSDRTKGKWGRDLKSGPVTVLRGMESEERREHSVKAEVYHLQNKGDVCGTKRRE